VRFTTEQLRFEFSQPSDSIFERSIRSLQMKRRVQQSIKVFAPGV